MIEEAYCSYEVSKLLKEKRFDENCRYHYLSKTLSINYNGLSYNNSLYDEVGEGKIAAPTQQMAMRWLREEKHIFISIYPHHEINVEWNVYDGRGFNHFVIGKEEPCTYEEAVDASVKYVLENLL